MKENQCKKCEELNRKLGMVNYEKYDYEAICDDCSDKRVDNYEKEKQS